MPIYLDSTGQVNMRRNTIDYTARDFDSIKEKLVDYVKINYPDSYKDFNASSFGSLMFDLVAYVGDTLAFYTDYVAGESNLITAQEQNSCEDAAAELGMPPALGAITRGTAYLYMPVGPNEDDNGPALEQLRGAIISASDFFAQTTNGLTFSLEEDIALYDINVDDFINTETADLDGSKVKFYICKIPVTLVSGQQSQMTVEVGTPTRTPRIALNIPGLTQIVSVVDSRGRSYFQVTNPSTDRLLMPMQDPSSASTQAPSIMRDIPTPRRFTFERRRGQNYLVFGNKSENDVKVDSVVDPSDVVFNPASLAFDPTKLVSSDKFGIAPENTTLTITYRYNDRNNVNVTVGALSQIVSLGITFRDETSLDPRILSYMRENTRIHNEEPINGDITVPTTEEIKLRAIAAFATQKRAVTLQDYKSSAYSMPSTYGKIKRCNVSRDNDDFRRNLNMFVVAEGADGKFERANTQLTQNVRTWLNNVRMISDSIDVFHANIINLGVEFDIIPDGNVRQDTLIAPIREMLYRELATIPPEIGEHFYLSRVFNLIQNFRGVSSVKSINLASKAGTGYNGNLYDIKGNLIGADRYLYVPHDHVWEIKKPSDIVMKRHRRRK